MALGLSSAIASANSITVSQVSATDVPGGSVWGYDLSFINSTLNNGDFVTINDFGVGAIASLPVPGWSFSQSLTGPNSLPASDDPGVLNVTLTWTGGNGVVVSPGPSSIVNQLLQLSSPLPVGSLIDSSEYTTIDHVTSGLVAGTTSRVIGTVRTPAPGSTVPDGGSSMALFGLALGAVQCVRRKLSR